MTGSSSSLLVTPARDSKIHKNKKPEYLELRVTSFEFAIVCPVTVANRKRYSSWDLQVMFDAMAPGPAGFWRMNEMLGPRPQKRPHGSRSLKENRQIQSSLHPNYRSTWRRPKLVRLFLRASQRTGPAPRHSSIFACHCLPKPSSLRATVVKTQREMFWSFQTKGFDTQLQPEASPLKAYFSFFTILAPGQLAQR